MTRHLRSLRARLAVAGFVAVYLPTLVLLAVVLVSETVVLSAPDGSSFEATRTGWPLSAVDDVSATDGTLVENTTSVTPWALVTAVLLAPVAAALAWWWSGRAVGPVRTAADLQERLIEEASHELRNPLAVLAANAEVLLAHPQPTVDVYRQGLERSRATARRMTTTMEALLADARGRARTVERRPGDLARLAHRVADALEPLAADRGVTVLVDAPDHIPARVDAPSLERALGNLLTNALRHAPAGSRVELTVAAAATTAEITVTDQGPGIAPAEQARVFERYWQAEPGTGAGLGLAITRQIAAAHGGSVTVRSPVAGNRGAQFRLRVTR